MAGRGLLVLALDVGTSSVRALLYDSRGRALEDVQSHRPYSPRTGADGTSEVDPERLLRLTSAAIDEVLAGAGTRAARIEAVGVSTFWHGLLAASPEGEPLTPLLLWSDTRSWEEAERLRSEVDAEAVRVRTGCPVHPSYWPSKLRWLRGRRPELWAREVRWLSFGDFLQQRLFGRLGTSLSMASGTGLLNTERRRWDEAMLALVGIDEGALPPFRVLETGLVRSRARRWPALASIPWLDAAGDGALANLGSGCADASQRSLTVGTSGALRVLGPKLGRPPAGLWRYLLDSRREVVGGALSNGGNLFAWLSRTLQVAEPALERALARQRPGGHGLTFLPLLAGERAPGYASRASGAIAGLTQATTPVDIVRAGLEAVAIEFARVDGRLDAGGLPRPSRVVASGAGLLRSPAWMQIMADALGRPLAQSAEPEASSRGAALLALEQIGEAANDRQEVPVRRTFEPSLTTNGVYRQEMARQEALYRVLIQEDLLRGASGPPAHLGSGS